LRNRRSLNPCNASAQRADTHRNGRSQYIIAFLYLTGVFVSPTAIIVLLSAGVETRDFIYPYRAAYAALSLIAVAWLFFKNNRFYRGWLWIPLVIFWSSYIYRIIYDGYLLGVPLRIPPIDYLGYALGGCVAPMVVFMCRQGQSGLELIYKIVYISCLSSTFVGVWYYRNYLGTNFIRLGMGGDETVNPLTIGYLGAIAVLLSVFDVLTSTTRKTGRTLLSIFGIAVGFLALIIGASRGAVLSLVTSLAFLFWVLARSGSWYRVGAYVCMSVGVIPIASKYAGDLGSGLIARISHTTAEFEQGSREIGRISLTDASIKQFMQSPLFGSGLEEKETKGYPHNLIVESFMTTGLLGGIAFCTYSAAAFWRGLLILRRDIRSGWISLLFISYCVEAMLSGAIYLSSVFWYLSATILSAELLSLRSINRHSSEL
jgi:hypothetical protein